jgi:putative heme-binding domain-containing protein
MLRVEALQTLQGKSGDLSEQIFALLIQIQRDERWPTQAMQAAQTLGGSNLRNDQLKQVIALMGKASPMQLNELLRSFARTRDPETIDSFLDALGDADAFLTISENDLSEVVKRFPQESFEQANQLLDRLKTHEQQKQARIASLRESVSGGDAEHGREVFMSEKAKCIACHRVGDAGHPIGPDLTTIGANRSTSDLLESIVLPSASIVRDYESYRVLTSDGRAIAGVVASETTDEIVVQQSTGEKITVSRDQIEQLIPNPISIMPNGLEEALSESELADVIAYLKSLR